MKEKVLILIKKIGISSERTKNITKHIGLSFLYKGGSVLAAFLSVPLIINYLDSVNYGIWLTIVSVIGWFNFFDAGLGHGLRNKFVEANAKGDITLARAYVSSAYFTIGLISVFLIILFYIINNLINWPVIFNTNKDLKNELSLLMSVVFTFFCLQLVLKLISTIYIADQRPSAEGFIGFITQTFLLIIIWIITKTTVASLLVFGTLFSLLPVLILLGFNVYSFRNRYRKYKPTIKLWHIKYVKDIFGLGVKFFLIQIAAIVLYSTQNMVIIQLFGPDRVIPYNLAFQYFSIIIILYSIIANPYWSAFTQAYTKLDFEWIERSIRNLLKIAILCSFCVIIMAFISDHFFSFWVGDKIKVPKNLSILMCIYTITQMVTMPFTFFINGTGKINIQLAIGLFAAIINIPLSVFLAGTLNMNLSGIILATIICNIFGLVVYPIWYKKILSKARINAE